MKTLLATLLLFAAAGTVPAQQLDTLEQLIASGRIVDAKQYADGLPDSSYATSPRYQLLKAQTYQELFKQSLETFGIKNNNWLATSCNYYIDGVTLLAKNGRVPDSLFALIEDCMAHTTSEALWEKQQGSLTLSDELYYSGHGSAMLFLLLAGNLGNDTLTMHRLGMYFYQKGLEATDSTSVRETHFGRAKLYLMPLAIYKREDVLQALKTMEQP